jgi:uncharacterized protein YbbK (DUF523 family)
MTHVMAYASAGTGRAVTVSGVRHTRPSREVGAILGQVGWRPDGGSDADEMLTNQEWVVGRDAVRVCPPTEGEFLVPRRGTSLWLQAGEQTRPAPVDHYREM